MSAIDEAKAKIKGRKLKLVMPEGDPVQHVADSLPDVHRRYSVGHVANSIKYYSCS